MQASELMYGYVFCLTCLWYENKFSRYSPYGAITTTSFVQKQKLFDLVVIRPGLLFQPNKHYVAELQEKDYLGKAKVSADFFILLLTCVTHVLPFISQVLFQWFLTSCLHCSLVLFVLFPWWNGFSVCPMKHHALTVSYCPGMSLTPLKNILREQ